MAKAPRKRPPVKKAASGTLGERLSEARTRPYKGTKGGVPARTNRFRGTMNTARTPDSIRMGQASKGAVTKPKVVPLGDKPKLLSGPKAASGGRGIRVTSLAGGPVGIAAQVLLTSATPSGVGSDKPSGPLFSPSKNRAAGRGNPKTINPVKKKAIGGGPVSRQGSQAPSMVKKKKDVVGNNPNRGLATTAYDPNSQMANREKKKDAQAAVSAAPPKPRLRPMPSAKKEMTFQEATRRNQSDEYLRKKMRPKGNLLSLFKKK
jgi:hypothetical protein